MFVSGFYDISVSIPTVSVKRGGLTVRGLQSQSPAEGVVYKKRGLGMFVSRDAPEILRKRFRAGFEREQIRLQKRLILFR
jgi:hypothetical protein